MGFRSQFHRRHALASLIILGLLLAACEPTITPLPTLTPSPDPSSVTVLPITPVSPTYGITVSETIPIENCAGRRDLKVSLGSVTNYGQDITLGMGAEVGGGVEAGVPQVVQASLETKISSAYENQIQQAQSRTNAIEYAAAPNSHVEYTIDWVETLYVSTAQYELAGVTISVPYTVTIYVPRPGGSAEILCPTSTYTSAPSPPPPDIPTDTLTPTLTNTPILTPTPTSVTPTETPPSTFTSTATATSTPTSTHPITTHLMIIFADEDSLTAYVPAGVTASLHDLNLEYLMDGKKERYYFTDSEGFAFYVSTKNLVINLGDETQGICAAGFSRCAVQIP